MGSGFGIRGNLDIKGLPLGSSEQEMGRLEVTFSPFGYLNSALWGCRAQVAQF
jgi:hypothetical protein